MSAKNIDFLFFDAGGGHRAAAIALKATIEQRYPEWAIRLVNLQEVMDELDIFRKITGTRMQDIYNYVLKKGWTLGTPQMTTIMHMLIRHYHPDQVDMLREFWTGSSPDLVVSLVPNFGRAIYQGLKAAHPNTPLVTILTDLADYPPDFWVFPDQEQFYICGTPRAYEQARSLGYTPDRLFLVSGMVLHPKFYASPTIGRAMERRRLGLDPGLPTGLILFGGQGSTVMRPILERVEDSGLDVQFIAICGKNEALRDNLSRRKWRMPVFVEGFTTDVPSYMRLSDFFIGKPGPGSISEAARLHLPVILERNAWTLPQERYNTDWIREMEAGIVLSNFRDIARAVRELLEGDTLARYRSNLAKLDNQAVFEIPPILDRLMNAKEPAGCNSSLSPTPN
jgi:1,2-diacylglycerol 3-beta-galactosyltransferase